MDSREIILSRFDALLEESERIDRDKIYVSGTYRSGYVINDVDFTRWRLCAEHLLRDLGDSYTIHLDRFRVRSPISIIPADYYELILLKSVIESARDDFKNNVATVCADLYVRRAIYNNIRAARAALNGGRVQSSLSIATIIIDFFVLSICTRNNVEFDGTIPSFRKLVDAGCAEKKHLILVQSLISKISNIKRMGRNRSSIVKKSRTSQIIIEIESLVSINTDFDIFSGRMGDDDAQSLLAEADENSEGYQ